MILHSCQGKQPGTTMLRKEIAPEERSLFYACAHDLFRLAQMGQGSLVPGTDELQAIIERP